VELQQQHQAVMSTKNTETLSLTSGISDLTVKSLRQPEDSEEGGVQALFFLT
jgi:hypothetical protein